MAVRRIPWLWFFTFLRDVQLDPAGQAMCTRRCHLAADDGETDGVSERLVLALTP